MGSQGPEGVAWQRSSLCNSSDNCVEVQFADGHVQVRDSKDPGRVPLNFTLREWGAFVAGVVRGDFDVARLISVGSGVALGAQAHGKAVG